MKEKNDLEKYKGEMKIEDMQPSMQETYEHIVFVLKKYIDMAEHYYHLVALWIIGTYFHKCFNTFPYLFINASKRSGKTRLLKLCSYLSKNGVYTANMTEAVLFRLPAEKHVALFIDEAENIGSRDKSNLRLLLNSAYKRGMKIYRARKVPKEEKYTIDEFEVFTPISIANITGINDVLEDRCISVFLEKSTKASIVNRPEWWEFDPDIQALKVVLDNLVQLVQFLQSVDIYINQAIASFATSNNTNSTNNTNNTNNNNYTNYTSDINIWKKIEEAKIMGRDLELWFPLMVMAKTVSEDAFNHTFVIAKAMTKEKQTEDIVENRDTELLVYLYQYMLKQDDKKKFLSVIKIINDYKENIDKQAKWFNSRWIGRAIKRMRIATDKRRMARGIQYILNFEKIERMLSNLGVDVDELKKEAFDEEAVAEIQTELKA